MASKHKIKSYLVIFIGIALFTMICLHWALPAIGIHLAKQWYAEQGEHHQLTVKDWSFSPWQGYIQLSEVAFNYQDERVSVSHLEVNIGILALFSHEIVIEEIILNGVDLAINQDNEGIKILGLDISTTPEKTEINLKSEEIQQVEANQSSDLKKNDQWDIKIEKISLNNHSYIFNNKDLSISLSVANIQLNGKDSPYIALNADFYINTFKFNEPNLALTDPVEIRIRGNLYDVLTQMRFTGDTQILNVALNNPWLPDMGFKKLSITGINISENSQEVSKIDLENVFIKENMLNLGHYQIELLQFEKQNLQTGLHKFSELNVNLLMNKNGKLDKLHIVKNENPVKVESVGAEKDPVSKDENMEYNKFIYHIAGIELEGSESKIIIDDPHLNPKVKLPIGLKKFSFNNLNNYGEATDISIQAKADEYNTLEIAAKLTPDANNGEVFATVKQFDLISLNGYVEKAIGYHVEKGQFNLKVDMKINNGDISGNGSIFIRDSALIPADQQTMDKISKQISMPIETALMLIKDDQNNLNLDIPLKGNINDPDFSMADLTTKISQTALTYAALHYVKQAIFPYGLVVGLADYIGTKVFSIYLDPIVFTAESLTEKQEQYLIKITQLMEEKESLQLHVCAQINATQAKQVDWQTLLLDQARQVKRYIVTQNENLAERIVLCQPSIANKTRVIMGF